METAIVWATLVLIIVVCVLIGFRKSWSKVIEGIKLREMPGGLKFDPPPQQQLEKAKEDLPVVPV